MRKGNRAPKLLSLSCFREKIKNIFSFVSLFPVILCRKRKTVLFILVPFQPTVVSILLAKQGTILANSKYLSPATFSALLQNFCLSWKFSVTNCCTNTDTSIAAEHV